MYGHNVTKKAALFIVLTLCTITTVTWYILEMKKNVYAPQSHRAKLSLFAARRSFDASPVANVVYIKTHKTGSTSLHCIICRYGYERSLSFVFSKNNPVNGYIRKSSLRPSTFLPPLGNTSGKRSHKYNILSGHVIYKRRQIHSFMKFNAKYITILREPAKQIESHMNFFNIKETVMCNISSFNENPEIFENGGKALSRNNQIRDLGLPLKKTANETLVNNKIRQLDKEFDLVLITEYFDESLVLLKHIFRWDFDDILYLSKNERTNRDDITDEFRYNIYQWSRADVLLYTYFNETLWRRIRQYGSQFENDLAHFRHRLQETREQCEISDEEVVSSHRASITRIQHLSNNESTLCRNIACTGSGWYKRIAARQNISML
uniref:Galactosylceramide sulfotransferase-like n=1 Tax=Saccoglossus kowalevskii TaxID=10224 RepID=A0ABM0MTV4_SACKO|nr:PREDICTED: galactosylceramide sulfotransferase-like [Saccoglossus kowalevskii]